MNQLIDQRQINIEDFNEKTATFLINIYYDLDNSKEYTKDELEPIWKRCNFQLEDYTNEQYYFEVTLNNLLKAGFLKTNGDNYIVNMQIAFLCGFCCSWFLEATPFLFLLLDLGSKIEI